MLKVFAIVAFAIFGNSFALAEPTGKEICEQVLSTNGYQNYPSLVESTCSKVETRPQGKCMESLLAADKGFSDYRELVEDMCLPIKTRGQLACAKAMFLKDYTNYRSLVHDMCLKFQTYEQGKCAANSITNDGNASYSSLVETACLN